jgi:hypothetical protein
MPQAGRFVTGAIADLRAQSGAADSGADLADSSYQHFLRDFASSKRRREPADGFEPTTC